MSETSEAPTTFEAQQEADAFLAEAAHDAQVDGVVGDNPFEGVAAARKAARDGGDLEPAEGLPDADFLGIAAERKAARSSAGGADRDDSQSFDGIAAERKARRAANAQDDDSTGGSGDGNDEISEPGEVVVAAEERFRYVKALDGRFGGYTQAQWEDLSNEEQRKSRQESFGKNLLSARASYEGSDVDTSASVGPDLEKDRRVIAGRESLRASTGSTEDVRTQERSAGTVAVFDKFGQPNFESPPVDRRDLRPISHVLRDAVRAANRRRKAAATERANNSRAPQETGADRTIPYDAGLDSAFSQAEWDDMTFSEQYHARQRVHDANREVLSDLGANPEPVTNTSKVSMRERASRIFVAAGEGLQRLREKGPTELIRNGWARAGVISNNALNSTAERARSMRSGGTEARRDDSEHRNRTKIILGTAIGAILVGGAVYIAKHGVESPVHLPDMGDALHPRVGRGGNNHVVGEAMGRRSGSNLHRLQELTPGQTRHLSTEQLNDLQNMTQQQVEALKTPEFARLVARSEKLNQFVRDIHPNWPNARVNEQAQRLLIDELERASSSAS